MKQNRKKTLIFFMLIITKTCYLFNQTNNNVMMLKGRIDSSTVKTLPQFKVYFQGTQTMSNADGFFTIPIEKRDAEYSLLICKDFNPTFDSVNTIKSLTINTKKPYKFYRFERANTETLKAKIEAIEKEITPLNMKLKLINKQIEQQEKRKQKDTTLQKRLHSLYLRKKEIGLKLKKYTADLSLYKKEYEKRQNLKPNQSGGDFWFITRKKFKGKNIPAPDNCVVVCLNPKTVNTVKNWNFNLISNFISFPRIVLKSHIEVKNVKRKKSITRSSYKSELNAIDHNVFHRLITENTHPTDKQENVHIGLVQ